MPDGTMAQQILASHSDETSVAPGDHITVTPDWILAHDLSTYPVKGRMDQLGHDAVANPEQVIIVFDHHVPSADAQITAHMNEVEAWVHEQGIENFYPSGSGICHNVVAEEGFATPGALILGADSHTTTHGAFGAFATGIGHTDCAEALGTGRLWLKVPETKKLVVDDPLPAGVTAKDLGLQIMQRLTAKGAIYDALEYVGRGIETLEMYERRTLSNLAVELGAMAGLVPPDETTMAYLDDRRSNRREPVYPGEDAEYTAEIQIDASDLEPLLARPSQVDNIGTVAASAGTPVDQVFVGTCNNSSFEDIAGFARMLDGERVAPGTNLIVVPGSRRTLLRLNETGLSNSIVDAGGIISPPGCGPCFGAHGGILGEGDVCLGTMNRNFPGRMGPGEIFIGSPETAAATAIYGEITDPREVGA